MLAFAWPWGSAAPDRFKGLSQRLAASLCAGIGGHAGSSEIGDLNFAYRPLRSSPAQARAWRPATLPDGQIALFHGYLDNADVVAADLGAGPSDPARLYGLAVERWGDEAEKRLIGEYCALIVDHERRRLRLSRSALRGPPLYYFHDGELVAVASVPRAILAAGVEERLNEARVADSALINFSDREASWFEGVSRVPHGHVVELERDRPRQLRQCYDLFASPDVRMAGDAEYMARASELLDEGVRACLRGFSRPGATLSGGLDSPQIAVRVLAQLPESQHLPTFSFVPEPGYDGIAEPGMTGNERPIVEAFAAMHPRIQPHFTANEGYEHDYRWAELFHLMGGAPSGLCNMYVFHGLFSDAARANCDVLLVSDWGNFTFSDKGTWGFVEYLLKGRWGQLWRALANYPDRRSMLWRFFAHSILPLLPNRAWRFVRRFVFRGRKPLLDLMQPLSPAYRAQSGADSRLEAFGFLIERYQPRNRRHAQKLLFDNFDGEPDEVYQAFEQMYGIPQRDPMAYRPFVEFCFGLPVEMFMRNGEMRWMAKQMAKGIMPEEQRRNRLNGRWDADWHLRIGRRRKDFLAELDRIQADQRLSTMLDLPRLRQALEDWPERTETDPQKYFGREFAVPRALLTARFINYVERSNAP
ncbi:MAG TPA: asparagine synthase-related protein [Sphingomicrobium sp.]|nr:asparagine synthase-related protein [Sphingomicrobium sp.]